MSRKHSWAVPLVVLPLTQDILNVFCFTLSSLSESWMRSLSKVTQALNFVGYNYHGAVSWKML